MILQEAIAVGILLLLISIPAMGLLHRLYPEDYVGCEKLPPRSKTKYYITTFIIGFITHLVCEFTGINDWYCKNGNACLTYNPKVENPASIKI